MIKHCMLKNLCKKQFLRLCMFELLVKAASIWSCRFPLMYLGFNVICNTCHVCIMPDWSHITCNLFFFFSPHLLKRTRRRLVKKHFLFVQFVIFFIFFLLMQREHYFVLPLIFCFKFVFVHCMQSCFYTGIWDC